MDKYYVVWEGRHPGVYDNWEDCQEQVNGFPGAKYRAFKDRTEAVMAFRGDSSEQEELILAIAQMNSQRSKKSPLESLADLYIAFPEINKNAWAVDGACAGVPGPMEYRGVDLATGQQLFHFGPVPNGTNNVAEYLAIVHALALLYNRNDSTTPIYSDSRTARAWVRNRRHKCTLERNAATARIFDLLDRADRWLQTHPQRNPILVWNTALWGEIPADFGRK